MVDSNFSGSRSPEVIKVGEKILAVVVEHAVFQQIRSASIDLARTMRSLRMPSGILIQADPGMGKTLLLELVRRSLVASGEDAGSNACVRIGLDNAVDTHGIAAATMLALGYHALPSRPNLTAMNHMVNVGFERQKPWAVLVDEMQHVCEGNKDITARSVTDWLKVRMDAYNFPVICAGTRALERLPAINPQFCSRASVSFVIHPFQFDDSWRQLLGGFVGQVNVVDLRVIQGDACRPLYVASGGNMRMLKRILFYASMHAAEQANRVVTLENLAKALLDAKGQVAAVNNPFTRQQGSR